MSGSSVVAVIPNLITIARLLLVPVVISCIIDHRWQFAFFAFVTAGVSDAIDGFLAKRFDLATELGAYLDPLADKILLVAIYIALALVEVVPSPLTILVVSRDLLIVGAVILARVLDKRLPIRPIWLSKVNTATQIAFAAAMLAAKAFAWPLQPWVPIAIVLVAALTLVSAAAYLKQWLDQMAS